MSEQAPGFWSTLPGILTGIAAMITAGTGLYIAVANNSNHKIPANEAIVKDSGSNQASDEQQDSISHQSGNKEPVVKEQLATNTSNVKPMPNLAGFPETGHLVDCTLFPTVNTVASLMSWSNYYHKQIIAAGGVNTRASDPCNKTIDYRGMAHCKRPDDPEIRQAFLETLELCRKAGIEWQHIQHTSIQ